MPVSSPQRVDSVFKFRAFIHWDTTFHVWTARCLETGSVATADTPEECSEMILELLQDELQFSLEKSNLKNLYNCCADLRIWVDWMELKKEPVEHEWITRWGQIYEFPASLTIKTEPRCP